MFTTASPARRLGSTLFLSSVLSHILSFIVTRSQPPGTRADHKLSRSMLSRSPLRTRRTTPSLKNFSSPPAVRPPMYHLSAPITSRKPSDELSLPRRLLPAAAPPPPAPPCCGIGMALCCRGECRRACACAAAEDCAWAWADEAMERGAEAPPAEV